ncbi:RAMP superfamily CRISPR-associated protein [Afifella aestuarii]|uniref:RAMP superfamily CRISPR-associated protein n=1 Tax=Afifella aestuarii TaxID=1909496 RepID=UPI000FE2BA74|nr:RAMP superfamily CRISPR-associated protein [Afifella aestuarii]
MIGAWTEIEVIAVAATPLMIGSGDHKNIRRHDGKDLQEVELALVAVDEDGKPVIPGSTLKGALRALAVAGGCPGTEALFGPERIDDPKKAKSGRLICWTGRFEAAPDMGDSSIREKNIPGHGTAAAAKGLFVDARTAIDPASGVAWQGRLFHVQAVAKGTTFRLRFGLQTADKAAIGLMQSVLAQMARDGLVLGKGRGVGQGSLKLCLDELKVVRHDVDVSGAPAEDCITDEWREAIDAVEHPEGGGLTKLLLTCKEAFISNDNAGVDYDKDGSPKLVYLREPGTDKPRLTGASLRGALRARAVWLERLRDPDHRDNRDLILDKTIPASDADLTRPRARCKTVGELSSTELLFGINGWRGRLRIVSVQCGEPKGSVVIRSVRLDRFSGGPMHGALFSIEAARAPDFEAWLALDPVGPLGASEQDTVRGDLLRRLIEDLKRNGLRLGHGTNKGYGWFDVV